jgi:hypothetical protein
MDEEAVKELGGLALYIPPPTLLRVCVLFIGTQFSILYISMFSPAGAASYYLSHPGGGTRFMINL